MGWWSATVMGGDTPCDYIYDLENAAGIEDEVGVDGFELADMKAAINKNLNKVFAAAKKIDADDAGTDDEGIMAQVLGFFIVNCGANMTEEIRQFVLNGIEADQWSKGKDESGRERKRYLDHFKKQIKNYTATRRLNVAQEGLFDAFAKMSTQGKTGLVNKNT